MYRRPLVIAALATLALGSPIAPASAAAECPDGGAVRFGIEPFEAAARLIPVYEAIAKLLSDKVGCPVSVFVTPSYNAEIEAMRSEKLDVAEFGPLGYVFAHDLAGADVFASYNDKANKPSTYTASIVTWNGSGLKSLKDVAGKSMAFSDPASTSGHLYPSYALRKAGIDPDNGVKPLYAGSHTASFETIRNHKADAGELNSTQIDAATNAGSYNAADYVTLWRSQPIPNDPLAVRRTLSTSLKKKIVDAFMSLDFRALTPEQIAVLPSKGTTRFVAQDDKAYDEVRDLVKTMKYERDALDKK